MQIAYLMCMYYEHKDSAYTKSIVWLKKIVLLILEKGWAAIDEAHSLLNIRKELICELVDDADEKNSSLTVDVDTIELTTHLYIWLYNQPSSLLHHIKNPDALMDESRIKEILAQYIERLVQAIQEEHTPYWINNLLAEQVTSEQLGAYLSGTVFYLPEEIKREPRLSKQWIVLRAQFQILLPMTLRQKIYEHYGPQPNSASPYAIPYRANNVPTECVFSHFMETVNYTAQMIIEQGISVADLKSILRRWQEEAFRQRQDDNTQQCSIDRQFVNIFPDESVKSILDCDLNDDPLVKRLHVTARYNSSFMATAMQKRLQQLELRSRTWACDSINFVSQFARITALSATPYNYQTYHQSLHLIQENSPDIEEQVKNYLIEKKTPLHYVEDIHAFLATQLQHNKKLRALIDYGGFFQGMSNKDVAQSMVAVCNKNSLDIDFVLFYQGSQLYALSCRNGEEFYLPATSAHEIEQALGCLIKKMAIYFDQEHTEGSDVILDGEACGILTIDILHGILSQALQAAMRLRGLAEQQSIIIALNKPGFL